MINISQATVKDKSQLIDWFRHYQNKDLIKNRVDSFINHNFTVVAKDDDKIIGILQWLVKEDPNMGVVEFEEIHVSMAYQKHGIGSKMMDFTIKSVKDFFKKNNLKLRKIYLFVSENNLVAQDFYQKFGFKEAAKINNLFSDSGNELFYVLDF